MLMNYIRYLGACWKYTADIRFVAIFMCCRSGVFQSWLQCTSSLQWCLFLSCQWDNGLKFRTYWKFLMWWTSRMTWEVEFSTAGVWDRTMNTLKHSGYGATICTVPFDLTLENSSHTHLVFKYDVSLSQKKKNSFPQHHEQVRIALHHYASPKVVK